MTGIYDGRISAALALTAVMAIGCSNGDKPRAAVGTNTKRAVPTTFTVEKTAAVTPAPASASPAVSFANGDAAYQAGNYTEAVRLFAGDVEQHPDNAWTHYMLGLSAWKSGDGARAESAFTDALKIDPDHVKSLVNLSRVLLDQKRPAEAVERLTRASEIDPMSGVVYRLLGRAYHAQGKIDDAVNAYRRAIELDARDSWAMNNLGLLFLDQGRAEEAVPLLARAVELRKDVPAFHNNLGMALEHTGRFKAAAGAYAEAVSTDPGYAKAKQNLARVEQVKEQPQEPFDLETAARQVSPPPAEPDTKAPDAAASVAPSTDTTASK